MRFLMKIEMPTVADNAAIGEPDFNDKMRNLLGAINAESASFSIVEGRRIDLIIVNVADFTELPALADPFYRWLKVRAEFLPEIAGADAEKAKQFFDAAKKQSTSQ